VQKIEDFSSMGESPGVKDSSITRSKLCPEECRLKLARKLQKLGEYLDDDQDDPTLDDFDVEDY
jgi:hypothetical protein